MKVLALLWILFLIAGFKVVTSGHGTPVSDGPYEDPICAVSDPSC
jgi:hypothetical protein